MCADPNDAAQERADFLKMAVVYGFTEKEVDEVIRNATYGGMGGVGLLVAGDDIVDSWHEWSY